MLDAGQLRSHIKAIDKGDDASRRQALQSLKTHENKEWAEAPQDMVRTLIECLLHQLVNGLKPPFVHKEVAIILGNMGTRSKSAIPQLIELLSEGIPDPVRETAATALGKIGK